MIVKPAGSPPLLLNSSPGSVDTILIPDLLLDVAVKEYSSWQLSQVNSQIYKDNIEKACDLALINGLDL